MKQKADSSIKQTNKKGRLCDSATNNYHCTSGFKDLDLQAQNANHAFNQGKLQVALESFTRIHQSIFQNSPHNSPQKHSFFLHIVLDILRCHLALLEPTNAFNALLPCYQWAFPTSISLSNLLWSAVSFLVSLSQKLIQQKEQIKTMIENEQWRDVTVRTGNVLH
jgi:hypothetical protein